MKTGVSIGDAMTQDPIKIGPEETIVEASKLMLKKRVGSLLVMKGKKLAGLITEKDVVRVIARGFDPKKLKVEEIMTKKIHTAKPDDDLYKAVKHMKKNKVKKLPVVYKGNLVGMLTLNDVLKIQPIMYEILYEWGNIKASKEKYGRDDMDLEVK